MINDKLLTLEDLISGLQKLHAEGKTQVFTNGCFDIIHSGHVLYLEEAKALGDILVVGINSDDSISRLKGSSRPIIPLQMRMITLAALEAVDYVIAFDEDTPYELIKALEPDILVKGGDWQPEQIVGSELVLARGGKVQSLSFMEGISTSEIIRRIATNV